MAFVNKPQAEPAKDGARMPDNSGDGLVFNEIQPVQNFDIAQDRQQFSRQVMESDEIDSLTAEIEVYNLNSIATFGAKAAEAISKSSDKMLRNMDSYAASVPGDLFKTLAGIMSRFDIDEIKEDRKGLRKLFEKPAEHIDKLLVKYHGLGDEVDRIYVQFRQYEKDLCRTNLQLEDLFYANVETYHRLVKYIIAGEQGCKEIEEAIAQKEKELSSTGNETVQFELTTLKTALRMLEQRIHDLRITEAVALQTIPMIKTMQFNNYNLIRKINSAFIVTLPVFKQSLSQAILLKKNRIQSDAMAELDKKAKEMAKRNAPGMAGYSKGDGASDVSSNLSQLEDSWKTITEGISETEELQKNSLEKRTEDKNKLENLVINMHF